MDVFVPEPGDGWRVRLVGARRTEIESMDLKWHGLGDDLMFGRSRESWSDLDEAQAAAVELARCLRQRRRL